MLVSCLSGAFQSRLSRKHAVRCPHCLEHMPAVTEYFVLSSASLLRIMLARAASLHACELASRRPVIRHAPRKPQRSALEAVHAQVKAQQVTLAQQARRGTSQRAVAQSPVDTDICAQLPSYPADNVVRFDAVHPRLPNPPIEQPVLSKSSAHGHAGFGA